MQDFAFGVCMGLQQGVLLPLSFLTLTVISSSSRDTF